MSHDPPADTITPTLLGHIGAVIGSAVSVRQLDTITSGVIVIDGKQYRVGQVGSFVRIPQGKYDLYGIIADIGATAPPETLQNVGMRGGRWITVQLVGEMVETIFERGISQYPLINDEVHLVTEDDLAKIYGTANAGQITIGRLSGAENIPVRVDLDKLVTRHSAVLGSTGAGKSTTITSLLKSLSAGQDGNKSFPSARVLLIDIHGEYGQALKDDAKVFRVNPMDGENPLYMPFWALDLNELLPFLLGKTDDKALSAILDKILAAKLAASKTREFMGLDANSLTFNSPIPFSLKTLWADLIDPEIKTWYDPNNTVSAILKPGDPESLTPPTYPLPALGNAAPFANSFGVLSIRRQLNQLRSRLLDKQYDFMLHPGDWEPKLNGVAKNDLPQLLNDWLGHDKPITVLDLSGVPSPVLLRLIGGILNIIYEALFWGRELDEGGRKRPLLVVMEEAHRYLSKESVGPAKELVQRIVKEGRKFGMGAMIVSQRPSEIDETILSQCGTFFSLRLSNSLDRSKVQAALPDSLSGLIDSLPALRTGEAIITGEAAKLPVRCKITRPPFEQRPSSEDPDVVSAWSGKRSKDNYDSVVAAWRSQNPKWKADKASE